MTKQKIIHEWLELIHIYAFGRCTVTCIAFQVHIYILSIPAFPEKRTNDLGAANTVLYYLSYKKVVQIFPKPN